MAAPGTSSNLGDDYVNVLKNLVEEKLPLSNTEHQAPKIPQHNPEESSTHDSQTKSVDAAPKTGLEGKSHEQGPETEVTEGESPLKTDDATFHQSPRSVSSQTNVNICQTHDFETTDLHGWENDEFRIWAKRFRSNQLDMEDSENEELKQCEEIDCDEWEGNSEFSLWMQRYQASQTPKTEGEAADEANETGSVSKTDEGDETDEKSNHDSDYNEPNEDANDEEIAEECATEEAEEYKDPLRDDDAESDISVTFDSSCLFDEGWADNESLSQSEAGWKRQKEEHGQGNEYLDKIMSMVGLEEVKAHFLMVKASVEAAKRRDHDRYESKEEKDDSDEDQELRKVRLNILLVGNMGTGKSTIGQLYEAFLTRMKLVGDRRYTDVGRVSRHYRRTVASTPDSLLGEIKAASESAVWIVSHRDQETVHKILATPDGRWLFPTVLRLKDYNDEELMSLLERMLKKRGLRFGSNGDRFCNRVLVRRVARSRGSSVFGNVRSLEAELDTVCKRQAKRLEREWSVWLRKKDEVKRIEENKKKEEEGKEEENREEKLHIQETNIEKTDQEGRNEKTDMADTKVDETRVEENELTKVTAEKTKSQEVKVEEIKLDAEITSSDITEKSFTETNNGDRSPMQNKSEAHDSNKPNNFILTKDDVFGPEPSDSRENSGAYKDLQKMVGLKSVKEAVEELLTRAKANYDRELKGQEPLQTKLNRVFLGPPGTGKTTVATLFARILADLGLLSSGEVIFKNPTDMLSGHIGKSEKNTKEILDAAQGKVLVIDDAHMLYNSSGHGTSNTDKFRVGIVDTLVANISGAVGEDRCVILIGYEDQMKEMFQNMNPGLQRRFPLEDAYTFENYTEEELSEILKSKLNEENIEAKGEALKVAEQVLSRMRIRPNFGNGGEIDNLLSRAKVAFRKGLPKPSGGSVDSTPVVLEPQHFDPEYNRASRASENCLELFEGFEGFGKISGFFQHYQQLAAGMRLRELDPRPYVPWAFVFKGPPGTGKTSTARKVGQLYYDMNFLATPEVVTCSVTDLIGQYVGHTGPKVKYQLEQGLGKVLFIDEAYRLAPGLSGGGKFTGEAVGELVDAMTNPRYVRNMIIILAGYTAEMDFLMRTNQGLRGRFADHVVFPHMEPPHCLNHLKRRIGKLKIEIVDKVLVSQEKKDRVLRLFKKLSATRSWSNGRDVETLANTIIGSVFKAQAQAQETDAKRALTISTDELIKFLQDMLRERKKEQKKKGAGGGRDEDSDE